MELKKRACSIYMHLEKCEICGQSGFLELPDKRFEFITTDGISSAVHV